MFKFFDGLSNIISTIVDFFAQLIEGVLSLFEAIGTSLSFVKDAVLYLPEFLSIPLGVMIAACVVRFLIKWGAPE